LSTYIFRKGMMHYRKNVKNGKNYALITKNRANPNSAEWSLVESSPNSFV
jgi:hypothetical protein